MNGITKIEGVLIVAAVGVAAYAAYRAYKGFSNAKAVVGAAYDRTVAEIQKQVEEFPNNVREFIANSPGGIILDSGITAAQYLQSLRLRAMDDMVPNTVPSTLYAELGIDPNEP